MEIVQQIIVKSNKIRIDFCGKHHLSGTYCYIWVKVHFNLVYISLNDNKNKSYKTTNYNYLSLWTTLRNWLWSTSNDGRNLLSISTAATCLDPPCNKDLVREPGPAPTSHTWQSKTSATFAILSVNQKDSQTIMKPGHLWRSGDYHPAACIAG